MPFYHERFHSTYSRRWENSRRLCKPSTSSRVCITVSNSPNSSRVFIRLCKHGKRFLFLKCEALDFIIIFSTFERFVSEQNDECLSLKIINPVPHEECFVRYLRTSIIHCTHLSDFRYVNNS